ncbi:MAG: flippase-like domain-containing protein, partial [Intrasporangium sp.]|uniref:lysylphosphatidylglycerol synthase transmembrane domain-containing protein n=1 Tax=Intrasporangium sp. TaxID=1925024 RepID=UPI002649EAC4
MTIATTVELPVERPAPQGRWRSWLRLAVAVGVLSLLVVRFGSGPFVDAFRAADPAVLLAAVGVAAVTTVCCAYRWCAVGAGVGVPMRLIQAVPAYYRSQFLNATLPGGVLGDVDRGLRQRPEGGSRGTGLRAVAWERSLGQLVQVLLAVVVLLGVPSPLRARLVGGALDPSFGLRTVVSVAGIVAVVGTVVVSLRARRRRCVGAHPRRVLAADWRGIRAVPGGLPVVAVTSVLAVGGHVAVFLLAARSINPDLPLAVLVPSALLVLVVGALPVNLAGW